VVGIAKQVESILTQVFAINKRLKGRVDISVAFALSDIKAQLNQLVFPGFVTSHGWKRLADIPRYLSAIEKRMEKLAIDPNRDRAQMSRVENVILQWQQWLAKLTEKQKQQEEV
uniref:DUF3418 domain-containing protein n=1 Tax=Vibrio cholerae TaxID=666 RepID=UPI00028C716D